MMERWTEMNHRSTQKPSTLDSEKSDRLVSFISHATVTFQPVSIQEFKAPNELLIYCLIQKSKEILNFRKKHRRCFIQMKEKKQNRTRFLSRFGVNSVSFAI